jgi:bifunctional non-homologous end joining protein LigD
MSTAASVPRRTSARSVAGLLHSSKTVSFPGFTTPCLATSRTKVTTARGFVHELKLDGYRVQAHLQQGRVKLYTRSGLDWTTRFPTIVADVTRLPAEALVIDGEIISPDANGRPSFSALQDNLKRRHHDHMVYYAFDLLHIDGFDARAAPLVERKRVLEALLSQAHTTAARVLYSEHFDDGAKLYSRVSAMGLEGIVSKRADAPYRSGRGDAWLKVKCWKSERLAVIGFVPEGSAGLLSLCLARRKGGALVYVGRVGTGWDRETARLIRRALEPLKRPTTPLAKPLKNAGTRWVEPRFDAEIAYSDVTSNGMLCRPSFKRLVSREHVTNAGAGAVERIPTTHSQ